MSITHGKSKTRIYNTWQNMKKRCNSPTNKFYYRYGGRGITYCSEWENFEPFYEWAMNNGYQENLTIDRIDVDGNYCPENCRWVDRKIQLNNTSRNHYVIHQDKKITVAQLSEKTGVNYHTILSRLGRGRTLKEVTTSKRLKSPNCSSIYCFGETHTYAEWSRITGINRRTLRFRIAKKGMSPEEALQTPVNSSKSKASLKRKIKEKK